MELDSPYINLRIKDHILVGTYKTDLRINLEAAKEIVRTRISFTGDKKMPSLIIIRGVVSIDKPAREYLSSAEATRGLAAAAMIVHSAFSSSLGNFFLAVHKTNIPVKLFSDTAKAELWLQQYIE